MAGDYDTWLEGDCGIDAAEEALQERRDEYIEDNAPAIAKAIVGSEDFAWDTLVNLSAEAKNSILQDVGRFFERFHNTPGAHLNSLLSHACHLYRELLPTIEGEAEEQAKEEAGEAFDRMEKDAANSEAEYRTELGAAA